MWIVSVFPSLTVGVPREVELPSRQLAPLHFRRSVVKYETYEVGAIRLPRRGCDVDRPRDGVACLAAGKPSRDGYSDYRGQEDRDQLLLAEDARA